MPVKIRIVLIVQCLALLGASGEVSANPKDAPALQKPAVAVWNDSDLDARLDDLAQTLESQKTQAEYWEYGWGAFDAGTMIASAIQAGTEHDRKDRNADIVQASESLIGLADVMFRPLPAFRGPSPCADPLLTREDKLRCLGARESLLQDSAERAHQPYEWLPHLGNLGFNLAAGILVDRVADRRNALITAIPGELIGELQIWTTPGQPMRDLDRYRLRFGPLLAPSEHSSIPATGIMAKLSF